jgi:ABC-type polysaccharide/polyol phosphate transport system ATPase subunit
MTPCEAPPDLPGDTALAIEAVSKRYQLYERPAHRLLEGLTFGRRALHRTFWALRDVGFEVATGTTMGIIGRNGSGKSTLLQIIAGTLAPTSGRVLIRGRSSALLELGSGFNGEFTGRENVFLNGVLMGLDTAEVADRYESIVRFADIGEFIDQPVKTYSSGMLVRLAFAVAVHVEPDVLIVDEALAVGDILFQHKCIQRMQAFMRSGRTVLFVSHDVNTVKMLCDRAVLLDQGRVLEIGEADRVARAYHRLMFQHELSAPRPAGPVAAPPVRRLPSRTVAAADEPPCRFRPSPDFLERVASTRFGDGRARIVNVELLNLAGEPIYYAEFDEEVLIDVHVEFHTAVERAVIGYLVRNQNGVDVVGTNTFTEGVALADLRPGDGIVLRARLRLPVHPGAYTIAPAVVDETNVERAEYFDWVDNALAFEVLKPRDRIVYAMFYVDQHLRVERV